MLATFLSPILSNPTRMRLTMSADETQLTPDPKESSGPKKVVESGDSSITEGDPLENLPANALKNSVSFQQQNSSYPAIAQITSAESKIHIDPLALSFASMTLRESVTHSWETKEVNETMAQLSEIRDLSDFREHLVRLNRVQKQVNLEVRPVLQKLLEMMIEVSEYADRAPTLSLAEREEYNRVVDQMSIELQQQAIINLAASSPDKMSFFREVAMFGRAFWAELYLGLEENRQTQAIGQPVDKAS